MAGGQVFGFLGVLLALPVAAVAMVVLRYAHQRYLDSALYLAGAAAEPAPSALATADEVADTPSAVTPDESVSPIRHCPCVCRRPRTIERTTQRLTSSH